MANFKPQVRVITQQTNKDYHWRQLNSPYKTIEYKTYAELRRNLKKHLEENLEAQIPVCRSRRGKDGEWFENWKLINGKPKIINQGWM